MNEKIGIIGFGNMGAAIGEAIKKEYRVRVFDKDRNKTDNLVGITVEDGTQELIADSEILILAVKPQDFDHVLKEIKSKVPGKLIISIAAGISTAHIEKILGNIRVVRAMPNLGVKIRESVTCICKGIFASEADRGFADELFGRVGVTRVIEESMMDAATAISGSGPGYIFDYLDKEHIETLHIPEHTRHVLRMRLEKAAEEVGFSHDDAVFLAVNTANAAMNIISKAKLSPAELRSQVASKGGTTEAGLAVLNKGGTWEEAAQAALKRARELAKGN